MTASRFRIAARTALLSSLLTFSAILVWPFPAHSQAPEARSKPELVTSDSSRATAGGATFTVPAGWSIETEKNLVILAPPEPDTHIVIFDSQASDAASAVTAAWSAYKSGPTHPVKIVTPRPAREGWDERQVFDYETSPNERAVVQAVALRAGTAWIVFIIDGTDPPRSKSAAHLFRSFMPAFAPRATSGNLLPGARQMRLTPPASRNSPISCSRPCSNSAFQARPWP
jgi:hypothetical protein